MEKETAHPDIQLPIAPRRAFDAVGHQSPSQLSSQRLPPEHQEQLLLKTAGHDLCKPPKSNEVLVLNGAALCLYPISLWSDAVFRKQFRLSARVCLHLERWPAAATFWNPPDNAEAYFTNQPFRKRGRPQVRWDDNLRKFGEMQFQQKTWSIPARHTSLWRSFENEYVQFCRETIAL